MHSIFLPSTPRLVSSSVKPAVAHRAEPRIKPLPYDQWPFWARVVAFGKYRQPQDTGLGDTIVHLIGDPRSERFKTWFQRKFGKSCGCTARQRWLNARFPYL